MDVWMLLAAAIAGTVSSVAGMGGGLFLLLFLGLWLDDPVQALVVTSPALLLGNMHRTWSLRDHVDLGVVAPIALAAVPASFVASRLVVDAPVALLRWALLAVAVLGCMRALGWLDITPSRRWAVPLGLTSGVVQATAGSSGPLLAPYILARGLEGSAYVASISSIAVVLHLTRLLGFGSVGRLDAGIVLAGLCMALAVTLGNLMGFRIAEHLQPRTRKLAQVGALLGTAGLAAASAGPL